MTQKDFFDISCSIKRGDKIRINIKKNTNTFFQKKNTAVLTYSNWRYDEENIPVIDIYFKEGFIFELSQLESIEILED